MLPDIEEHEGILLTVFGLSVWKCATNFKVGNNFGTTHPRALIFHMYKTLWELFKYSKIQALTFDLLFI